MLCSWPADLASVQAVNSTIFQPAALCHSLVAALSCIRSGPGRQVPDQLHHCQLLHWWSPCTAGFRLWGSGFRNRGAKVRADAHSEKRSASRSLGGREQDAGLHCVHSVQARHRPSEQPGRLRIGPGDAMPGEEPYIAGPGLRIQLLSFAASPSLWKHTQIIYIHIYIIIYISGQTHTLTQGPSVCSSWTTSRWPRWLLSASPAPTMSGCQPPTWSRMWEPRRQGCKSGTRPATRAGSVQFA